MLENESDAELREMAKDELDQAQSLIPVLEEEIKLLLIPADPEDSKMQSWKYVEAQVATKLLFLPGICTKCIQSIVNQRLVGGCYKFQRRGCWRIQGNRYGSKRGWCLRYT